MSWQFGPGDIKSSSTAVGFESISVHRARSLGYRFVPHFAVAFLVSLLSPNATLAQDFNGDGKPDILWHNKVTGANAIWFMNGTELQSSAVIQPSTDLAWKMVGAGFFDADDQCDIVWQHEVTGQKAVWLMKGSAYLRSAEITPDIDRDWRIVGAGDFNGDKKTDLVWQHSGSGEKAIWLMDGVSLQRGVTVERDSGRGWRICAIGQFGGDETPDLVVRHRGSGRLAIWIMNGTTLVTNIPVPSLQRPDLDWQLVGAADFNIDGHTDLLWRHATLGLNLMTFMNGTTRLRENFIQLEADTDWRMATQDMPESRYRLEADYGTILTARANHLPKPQIVLNSNVKLSGGQTLTVHRRLAGETRWGTPLATNLAVANYADTNVAVGQRYEYQWTFNRTPAPQVVLSAAVAAAPVEQRGTLLLLVDKSLLSHEAGAMNAGLRVLIEDLVGDGWTVVRKNVPRHDDGANEKANRINKKNLAEIKSLIREESKPIVRGVLIVGHVTIPYSGYHSADGHVEHRGAWPADMYYGDIDGEWTDGGQTLAPTPYPENSNVPGDGKFDNDFPPSDLEMFVGRVDFARLSLLGTGNDATRSEGQLIDRYFEKAHRYRFNLRPYPLGEAGIAYSYFSGDGRHSLDEMIYENALRNFSAFFPEGAQRVKVGDAYEQRGRSYLWGFLGGNGGPSVVNVGMYQLEHSVSGLLNKQNEARIGFYMMVGSYFGDWNLSNNLMRATLATPNFGLAAVWMSPNPSRTRWRFQGMGLGQPLGDGLLSTVNGNPNQLTGDNNRLLAILGDPTLRLHVVAPPSNLRAVKGSGSVILHWTASSATSAYWIYRGPSQAGPFTRVSPLPITDTTFTDDSPSDKTPIYMVRALKLVTSGCGAYTNLSQGIFASSR